MLKKYFIYSFNKFYGNDKIFCVEQEKKLNAWDFYEIDWDFLLVIGESISNERLYRHKLALNFEKPLIKSLVSKKTLLIVDEIVRLYFSTYRHTIPLFLWQDIQYIIKNKLSKKIESSFNDVSVDDIWCEISFWTNSTLWQILIVFPDLWTYSNYSIKWIDKKDIKFLHSKITDLQKSKAYWEIKNWLKWVVFCTYSQIFQDWSSLQKIIIIDSHKWYYKNQQDPRYYVPSILKIFSNIYWSSLEVLWIGL